MREFAVLCGISLFAICGCQKKEPVVAQPPKPATVVEAKKSPFVAPADSAVSMEQVSKWLTCHELLDSLSYLYADSFKTEDAAKRLVYQNDFTAAQDRICVRAGLLGGYEEYQWILDNIGNPRNQAIAESMKIAVR